VVIGLDDVKKEEKALRIKKAAKKETEIKKIMEQ
jgi:hypothetical protein